MTIINTLAPVFLLILLGALLVRGGLIPSEVLKGLNKLTYWVALPTVIFHALATMTYEPGPAGRIFAVMMAGTFGGAITALVLGRLIGVSSRSMGTFLQATFRGNLAFIGLPVILYAFASEPAALRTEMTTAAILAFAPTMLVYNILAVLVLLLSSGNDNRGIVGRTVRQLATNPLVLAAVAGILFSLLDFPLPVALDRSLEAVGQMALPLALLCIGGTLIVVRVRGSLAHATTASLLKVAAIPAIGFAAAMLLGLSTDELRVAMILLASPTAAASFVLAQQLYGDEALASSSIVISTVLSLGSLTAVVWLL